ncbi:unnamed protein product [Durusdinium trenchii]|uniref:N-acetyltransferase domain-containing protein n=1 Tax=Durusdinium trenchii TaxID=1381693 RepID=A0ABP0HXQ3_9DINO
MTILWSKENTKSDLDAESTEFEAGPSSEASEAEWVTSLWLDVKPAAEKTDEKQTEMMGFIVFRIKPERNALIIAQLAEHRRMGFGSLLLKTLIAEAKRLPEINSIGLSSLPGSIKFYKRHGFKLIHRLPDSEAKAEGQVYMELKTPTKKKK